MKLRIIMFSVIMLTFCADQSFAYEGMKHDEGMEEKGSMMEGEITAGVTKSGAIKVGNTICPISKEKVGEMGDVVEYEYEGKIYNLCCTMCLKDFKKDPEKYIKMIDEMMSGENAAEPRGVQESEESHEGHDH